MPFSHHSHSGQFCGHGENTLEEVVQAAIDKKMQVFALTEHMPREERDLYPEEIKSSHTTATLSQQFHDYYHEALRLQKKYASDIKLLIGMEIDWIRPSSKEAVQRLLRKYQLHVFIGSVHHVHTIPIDYDRNLYVDAREKAGGIDERLFEDYFDLQYEMLKGLKPPIVGHFDLIRLMSDNPDTVFSRLAVVWQKILRNLEFIAGYGGVIELNSAALRKGMKEPYPTAEICKEFLAMGGDFTLSDDSHCARHVGTHYGKLQDFVERIDLRVITIFEIFFTTEATEATEDDPFPGVSKKTIPVANIRNHPMFD